MATFKDVQLVLDKILGSGPIPNHGIFWRGVDRDTFVAKKVFGKQLIVVGDPAASNLVKSLRGIPPFGSDLVPRPTGAITRRMPGGRPPASEEDIQLIENWITDGCPADPQLLAADANEVSDEVHITYWREVDIFFLQGLASAETSEHVGNVIGGEEPWVLYATGVAPLNSWTNYVAANYPSFEYVRLHQRRLFDRYYQAPEQFFDSIWKFGANTLPLDPLSRARPQHTMNSTMDWFSWIPHLDACLRAEDISATDIAMARGWQVGIVADAFLRRGERPVNQRLKIPDLNGATNLQQTVFTRFSNASVTDLLQMMVKRKKDQL